MKAFLLVIVVSACFIGIESAPASEDEDSHAKVVIANRIESYKKTFKSNKFAMSLIKSVDKECVLEHYKTNLLLEKYLITSEPQNLPSSVSADSLELTQLTDSTVVFANIALMCSNKLNAVLGFGFDLLFSFSNLVEAFKDEDFVKDTFNDLDCFYKYAVDNKFLDLEIYPSIDYGLKNNTQEECNRKILQEKKDAKGFISFVREFTDLSKPQCMQDQAVSIGEMFFFRYALLIPLGITDEQKIAEKLNFIKDTHEGLKKFLLCNVDATSDESETTTDNIV
jgi:hypothetical protein